jgi:hypothetical protein
MKRRGFLVLTAAGLLGAAFEPAQAAPITRHPRPGDADWPSDRDWGTLRARLGDRFIEHIPAFQRAVPNPFERQEMPGATQSAGWVGAWKSAPSACAVAAESAKDVALAVDFARRHHLRLVIKGTGHDYLGRSSAPHALLLWTHRMRQTTWHDNFVPQGAPTGSPGLPAVSVRAGNRWLEAYQEATTRHGGYVQGGGCTSVGACGGFLLGGGFGSFSKRYGTGAASALEFEVVTADGRVRMVNAWREPDLFWALRGGGGSTFGVVTRATLMSHDLPATFGGVNGTIRAKSDEAFAELIDRFCRFYFEALNTPHWGEQFSLTPHNSLHLSLVCADLSEEQIARLWSPLWAWLAADPSRYEVEHRAGVYPGRDKWDLQYFEHRFPHSIVVDPTDRSRFWWAGNTEEVGAFWYTYQSRWLPLRLFEPESRGTLARALFDASRHWPIGMHLNKGLAGAPPQVLQRCSDTSMNPVSLDAACLVIAAAGKQTDAPDSGEAAASTVRVTQAMRGLRVLTPEGGTYCNEADYFEPDWQRSFWGTNYDRLLAIKRRYDPLGLFHCHHSLGSEGWSDDQMTRSS